MKQGTDRRVRRTQTRLSEALASLIREKAYDSITVNEILDRADVGRSTFYTHFRDKDELLVHSIHAMLGTIEAPDPISAKQPYQRYVWFSLPIFEYVDRHRRAGAARMGLRGRAVVHEHLQSVLSDLIGKEVARDLHGRRKAAVQISPELLVRHVAATFILVLNWWVESRSPLPPRDADVLFRALIVPTLSSVLE